MQLIEDGSMEHGIGLTKKLIMKRSMVNTNPIQVIEILIDPKRGTAFILDSLAIPYLLLQSLVRVHLKWPKEVFGDDL